MNKISAETLNNEFTPSTPYVHKFRTEICKNFELNGFCKFGDEVSLVYLILIISYIWIFHIFLNYDSDRIFLSVHLLMVVVTWWSKQTYQSYSKPSFVKNTVQTDIAHTVSDANLFTI